MTCSCSGAVTLDDHFVPALKVRQLHCQDDTHCDNACLPNIDLAFISTTLLSVVALATVNGALQKQYTHMPNFCIYLALGTAYGAASGYRGSRHDAYWRGLFFSSVLAPWAQISLYSSQTTA